MELHLCSPEFIELVEILMPGTRMLTTNDEAFDLSLRILEKLRVESLI